MKSYIPYFFFLFCITYVAKSQTTAIDSVYTLNNFQKSALLLQKIVDNYGGKNSLEKSLSFSTVETFHFMGHFEAPEKTIPVAKNTEWGCGEKETILCKSEISEYGGNKQQLDILIAQDSIWLIENGVYNAQGEKARNATSANLLLFSPSKLLLKMLNNPIGFRLIVDKPNQYVCLYQLYTKLFYIYVDKKTLTISQIDHIKYDNVLGEVQYSQYYQNYQTVQGVKLPTNLKSYAGARLESDLNFSNYSLKDKLDSGKVKLPEILKQKFNSLKPILKSITIEKISENIHLVKFSKANNKSLIVNMGDYVAVFEAFADLNAMQELISQSAILYPGKPIKQVFVTHHHPDHAGGIKALADESRSLITTKGNAVYFDKILSLPHFSKQYGESKRFLKYEFVENKSERIFQSATCPVVAYEIGKQTFHTQEHLVFYFPNEKFLWTGDLIYIPVNEAIEKRNPRIKAIYDLIENKKIEVDKIFSAWPLHEQKPFLGIAELQQTFKP